MNLCRVPGDDVAPFAVPIGVAVVVLVAGSGYSYRASERDPDRRDLPGGGAPGAGVGS